MGTPILIGLLGLGTVGGGVARAAPQKSAALASYIGRPIQIKRVLVRDPTKPRAVQLPPGVLTTDPAEVLDDPAIDIIVEVIGGEEPAHDFLRRAIANGKHVVTANKEVLAKHGAALLRAAAQQGVLLRYEASVGGGIPIIAVFQHDLSANRITEIRAIINGTTNYILTKMATEGAEFATALAEAQALGYAEADPSADVDGHDAVYKLAILSSLAFHTDVRPDQIAREGIRGVTARDFRYAAELGYAIKLLAIARSTEAGIEARAHPAMIPRDQLLAKVDGVFNAIEVEGDLVGRVLFYGRGAGELPTTSAVVADVLDVAQSIASNTVRPYVLRADGERPVIGFDAIQSRYYLRIVVHDRPGVLAQIAQAFGDHGISIASVIQKETDEAKKHAELVIMTHTANEAAMQSALAAIRSLAVVTSIASFLRVEG
ncbi:MAG: homoserine dehydrogenase [Dehalococcoidia bacterium]|nr:homoserine dehydrogenase [Dehalococcoidia bacterium]